MARQLTRKDQQGKLYVRPRAIENKIDGALGQNWQVIKARSAQHDKNSPDYLPNEALLHLARAAVRSADLKLSDIAMGALLKRAEKALEKKIPDNAIPHAVSVRENAMDDFVTMVAQDGMQGYGDDLDFFEVNFAMGLRTLAIGHVRTETRRLKHVTEMPETRDDEGNIEFDGDKLAALSSWAKTNPSQQDALELDELLDAVKRLPEKEKAAVVLTRVIGFDEKDAADRCGITDRALRYRLANATKRLKDDGEKK